MLVRGLRRDGDLLRCACGREYPVVAGIPIVLTDLAGWAASEGADALRDRATPPDVERLLAVDVASVRNRRLLEAYRSAPPSPLSGWLAERVVVACADGPVLEAGAGLGHPGTVRVDLNLALLRAGPPPPPLVDTPEGIAVGPGAALVADAADPPFTGSSFSSIFLVNLLDSCRDPALVLAQADALLRPGGALVIGCAYAFEASITPVGSQFTEQALLAALRGECPFGPYPIDARLEGDPVDREWRIFAGARTEHRHRVQTLVARRPPPVEGGAG